MDNLNPEFLYPELAKQKTVFVSLMKSLSTHLRPAPYPYGLLTLRLLGKLGGKNRRVLREPIDISEANSFNDFSDEQLGLDLAWSVDNVNETGQVGTGRCRPPSDTTFFVQLPLQRCMEILRRAAISSDTKPVPRTHSTEGLQGRPIEWKDSDTLLGQNVESINLVSYCRGVIEETKLSQVESSLQVLRTSLTMIMDVESGAPIVVDSRESARSERPDTSPTDENKESFDMQTIAARLARYNADFHTISLGLMLGCTIEAIQDKELQFMKGMLTNIYAIVIANEKSINRVDANGSSLHPMKAERESDEEEAPEFGNLCEEGLGSLKPFGYFELNGPLRYTTDPLTVNKALAEFLSEPSAAFCSVGLNLLEHLLKLPLLLNDSQHKGADELVSGGLNRGSMIFFESLLSALCQQCLASSWSRRNGLFKGICLMVDTLGAAWGARYEVELMNVALFAIKSVPREMSIAGVKSYQFLIEICWKIFGKPLFVDDRDGHQSLAVDLLSLLKKKDDWKAEQNQQEESGLASPSDEVLQMLISEMASTNHLLR